MKPWKVISKTCKRIDSTSVELHMVVNRGNVERDIIVSGSTYDSHKEGDDVMLPDGSGTSEGHAQLLGEALARVLVRAGVINSDAPVTGPALLLAAEDYCKTVEAPKTEPAPPTFRDQVIAVADRVEKLGATCAQSLLSELEEYGKGDCAPENIRVTLLAMAMLEGAIEELR